VSLPSIRTRAAAAVLPLAGAAIALAACAATGLGGSALLTMLPALAFAALLLLLRRYPGERALIARHGPRGRAGERPRALARARVRPGLPRAAVRGALLMGRSLAVRPPPSPRAAGQPAS